MWLFYIFMGAVFAFQAYKINQLLEDAGRMSKRAHDFWKLTQDISQKRNDRFVKLALDLRAIFELPDSSYDYNALRERVIETVNQYHEDTYQDSCAELQTMRAHTQRVIDDK